MKLKRKDEYRDILLLERLVTKNIIRLQAYTRGFLLRQRMRIEEQYKIGKQQEEECILHVMKSRHKQQLAEAIIHDFLYYEDIVARNIICLKLALEDIYYACDREKGFDLSSSLCQRVFNTPAAETGNEYKNILVLQELVNKNIIRFQAYTRGYIVRHFREKKESIIKIQNAYRRYVCKNQYLQKIDACVKVQSMIRRYIARKQLRYVLKNAIKLQSYIRSRMAKVYVRDLRLSERLRIEEEYEKLLLLEKNDSIQMSIMLSQFKQFIVVINSEELC